MLTETCMQMKCLYQIMFINYDTHFRDINIFWVVRTIQPLKNSEISLNHRFTVDQEENEFSERVQRTIGNTGISSWKKARTYSL